MTQKRQKNDGRPKDRRAITSPENGRKGGHPVGPVGPQQRTRERAKAAQRHAELTAEVVVEQIARGALFDVGRLFYAEAGQELYAEDGPLVDRAVIKPDGSVVVEKVMEWRTGDVKRSWGIGDLKPIHELTEEERTCIAGIEVVMKNATAGDGQIDRVLKLKLADRSKYVELGAKYHALLTEKIDVNVTELGAKLDAAREAARKRNQDRKQP